MCRGAVRYGAAGRSVNSAWRDATNALTNYATMTHRRDVPHFLNYVASHGYYLNGEGGTVPLVKLVSFRFVSFHGSGSRRRIRDPHLPPFPHPHPPMYVTNASFHFVSYSYPYVLCNGNGKCTRPGPGTADVSVTRSEVAPRRVVPLVAARRCDMKLAATLRRRAAHCAPSPFGLIVRKICGSAFVKALTMRKRGQKNQESLN